MKLQDLHAIETGESADQRLSKAASIGNDVVPMLIMAAGLADEVGNERARDFFRGAATMAARGNAELVQRRGRV